MGSNACSTEYFYVATDGDEYLRGSEQFCGKGVVVRKSLFRSVVFAYTSGGSWGSFRCQMYTAPQPCDCGWSVNTKIVNGQETGINEYPGVVALKTAEESPPFCSGTIISHYYVLTAAHCTELVPNPATYIIKAGDHNLAIDTETKYAMNYYVAQIIQHPGYSSRPTMINDISLLRTTSPIEWSRGVGPMCLPPPGTTETDFTYTYVDLVGWGTKSFAGAYSDTLQKTTVIITDNESCARTYNDTTIYPSQVCTYDYTGTSRDSCQYDSGGPVIRRTLRQYILGCISFGKFCGQGGYATGVNTRVSSYLTWIYQNTGITSGQQQCSIEYRLQNDRQVLNITSRNYPNPYPLGTNCRYRITAPLDHVVVVNCFFEVAPNRCDNDYFIISLDGDFQLRDGERYCLTSQVTRISHFRSMVLAYASVRPNALQRGRFACQAFARRQACSCGWSVNTRITNGVETVKHEFPSMVALRDGNSPQRIFCGGNIVSRRHILTAAHCMRMYPDPSRIVAYVGDHNLAVDGDTAFEAQYRIQRIINHPNYASTSSSTQNDISILVTVLPMEWSRGVGPICLPWRQRFDPFAYMQVDVAGWGTIAFAGMKSNTLQKAQLITVENRGCQERYNTTVIQSSHICTYDYLGRGQDTCQYDSGGPVIWRSQRLQLLGLISFGQSCGQQYGMGINTRITSHLQWLWTYLQRDVCVL
ncbi:CUB and peptidase domain-containing protein 2-like [Musca vetustissima]|uniref:CUB and peptidase domain-containing protein 2-like n=1 Tax=Musca vetustissima TaxID=27455 RepID=UPI002AB7E56F|nr:CUB and peptidase domain-containing protein 2-like [Musca vetustissima]